MTRVTIAKPGVDVYLFPAVVGGGLGDVEEVLLAGRRLERSGFQPILYRGRGRELPRSVAGPWGWPKFRPMDRLRPRTPRAITLSAWWGVSAAPPVDAPFGRAGAWAEESAGIEQAYGEAHVLHVSFEEFARTLTSRAHTGERWREGGVALREIRRRLQRGSTDREVAEFREAYRRFRAFDRTRVLHLYPTFSPSRAFAREFPEAVQTGPFWPEPFPSTRSRRPGHWLWYASPGSSARLASCIAAGWGDGRGARTIEIRAPRSFPVPRAPGITWRFLPPLTPGAWRHRFAAADLRIVTGSRTLLEALTLGGPFLYFNGVLGTGRRSRRHRPEKIDSLLRLWRRARVAPRIRRELSEFSRLRSVTRILRDARTLPEWRTLFPPTPWPGGFRPPYDDAGALVESITRAFASGRFTADELVRSVRGGLGVPSTE